MHERWRRRLITTSAACLMAAVTQVTAQERYRLSDDDGWEQSEQVDPATPEGQLAVATRTLAEDRAERAEFLATQWIDRHGRHPLLPEAYLLRGDTFRARGDYYEALFDYEYIARMFPASDVFVTALARELEIAKLYAGGLKRKFLGVRLFDASDEAEELLIRVQERLPSSALAEDAGMTLANFYFERRNMSLAVEAYRLFIENYPRSDQISAARRRLIYAHLASFKGPEFDATGLYEARAQLLALKAVEPAMAETIGADAIVRRIDESDALKMLTTAQWYIGDRDVIGAEFTIRRLMKTYPRSVAAEEALQIMTRLVMNLPPRVLREARDSGVYPPSVFEGSAIEPAAGGSDEEGAP